MKDILKSEIVATFSLLFVLVLLLFSSCRQQKQVINTETIRTIEFHDTILKIEQDSASRKLLILCDSAYNAYVAADTVKEGQHVRIIYKLKNKIMTISAPVDSFEIDVEKKYLKESIKISKDQIVVQKKVINFWSIAFWILVIFVFFENLILAIIAIKK